MIWQKSLSAVQGKDESVDDQGFITFLPGRAAATPDAIYATFDGKPITFAELHRMSDAIALGLRRLSVERGDRVALMLRNSPESVAMLFGIAKSGAVWVPVNVQQRGEGLKYILEHSDPRVIVANADLLPTISQCGADLAHITLVPEVGDSLSLTQIATAGGIFDEAL